MSHEMPLEEEAGMTADMQVPSRRSGIDAPSLGAMPSRGSTSSTSSVFDTLITPCTSSTSSTDTPSSSSSFDTSSISSEGTNNSACEGEYLEPSSASSDPSFGVWKSYSLSDNTLLQLFQRVFILVWAITTACLCWVAQSRTTQAKEVQKQATELQKQLDFVKDESADLRRELKREKKDVADLKEMVWQKEPVIRDLRLQLKECDQKLVEYEIERSELEHWVDGLIREMSDVRVEKKELRQDIRRLRETEFELNEANRHLHQKAQALEWRNEVLEKNLEVLTRQRDEVVRFAG